MKWVKILFLTLMYSESLYASQLLLKIGPASVGNGGSNPLGIPPSAADLEVTYLKKSGIEWSFALVPNLIAYGYRSSTKDGLYFAGGGALIIDANSSEYGAGIGPYASVGFSKCTNFCYGGEFKQTLGFAGGAVLTPYATRIFVGMEI